MGKELKITNEDNMQLMARYEDNYFDLAIVDPPYGIDLANMTMGLGNSPKSSKAKNRKWKPKDWDNEIPTKEYFIELFRVSKNQIIWGGNYFDLGVCGKLYYLGIKKYLKDYLFLIVNTLGLLLTEQIKYLDIVHIEIRAKNFTQHKNLLATLRWLVMQFVIREIKIRYSLGSERHRQ
jgi:hypothetical protein